VVAGAAAAFLARGGRDGLHYWSVALLVAVAAALVEVAQGALTTSRSASLDDFVAGALGGLVGAWTPAAVEAIGPTLARLRPRRAGRSLKTAA
jgi:VanZ family protein